MVFKKIIFQNRYVELETPPPSWKKNILNFHFDYLNPSLIVVDITDVIITMIAEVIAASTILVKVGDCPCGNHMTGLEDSRAAEEMNRVLSQVNPFFSY